MRYVEVSYHHNLLCRLDLHPVMEYIGQDYYWPRLLKKCEIILRRVFDEVMSFILV